MIKYLLKIYKTVREYHGLSKIQSNTVHFFIAVPF
jgi:hypothetical protein